jgi:hypothetical protein
MARRLKTSQDCRRLLASLINDVLDDKIPESKGRTATYMLQTMIHVIENANIETRLRALEEKENEEF